MLSAFAFAHLHDMRRIREGKVGGRQESPTQCKYFLKRCFNYLFAGV